MRPTDSRRMAPKAAITMSTSSPVATVPVCFMPPPYTSVKDTPVGSLSTLEKQDRHRLLPRGIHQGVGAALAVCRDLNPHAADNGSTLLVDDIHRILIDSRQRNRLARWIAFDWIISAVVLGGDVPARGRAVGVDPLDALVQPAVYSLEDCRLALRCSGALIFGLRHIQAPRAGEPVAPLSRC